MPKKNLKYGMSRYNRSDLRMSTAEMVTATLAEAKQVAREKLMEDLKAVVTDAEERGRIGSRSGNWRMSSFFLKNIGTPP
jgi:hypothetical protein